MRPVLLGMCNPRGAGGALEPLPAGSAGHRLWGLVRDVSGMSADEYLRAYDRMNVLGRLEWDDAEARSAAPRLRSLLAGRRVAVLGAPVWRALGLPPDAAAMSVVPGTGRGAWLRVPHPSGRCLWYNDPSNRVLAGEALFAMLAAGKTTC